MLKWLDKTGPKRLGEIADHLSLSLAEARTRVVGLHSRKYHGNTIYFWTRPLPEHRRDCENYARIQALLEREGWFKPDSRIDSTICRWLVVDGKLKQDPTSRKYHKC